MVLHVRVTLIYAQRLVHNSFETLIAFKKKVTIVDTSTLVLQSARYKVTCDEYLETKQHLLPLIQG